MHPCILLSPSSFSSLHVLAFPPTLRPSSTQHIPLPTKIKSQALSNNLIDGQAQIQWSGALQLGLCGHLATMLTKWTLQLSLSGCWAEAWANEVWPKVDAASLPLPSRPKSASLALITQPPFSASLCVCVYCASRLRLIGCVRFIMPLMLWEALRLVYEVFMVTPPNNIGAGFQLLWQVIHRNASSFMETKHKAVLMPGHAHASL